MLNRIIDYPDAVLRNFYSAEFEKLAENCFTSKDKNYELLAKVTRYLHCGQICPLLHAVSILEDKAIEVMLDNYQSYIISDLKQIDVLSHLWLVAGVYNTGDQLKAQKSQIASLENSIYQLLNKISSTNTNSLEKSKSVDFSNIENKLLQLKDFIEKSSKHTKEIKETASKISHSIKGNIIDMTIDEKKSQIAKIAKILFKYTNEIKQSDLENYAKVATVAEFNKLIIERKVDLSKMDLNLPLYEILTQEPLLKGMNYNSVEDILLMHTYSQNKTQAEVRKVYTNLLNMSKISTDIMHTTALNLLKGDDLKIVFDPSTSGFYAPMENIIWIGAMDGKFTDESIAIHELGHYAISKLYPLSNMMPFDTSKLALLKTKQNDIYGYHLNTTSAEKGGFFNEAQNDINKFLKYELAAKKVFVKAGELLGLNSKAFDPYILSKDFILFLKDNSPIDLFMLDLEKKMGIENNSLSRKIAISDAYMAQVQKLYEDDVCPSPSDMKMMLGDDTCSFSIENYLKNGLTYNEIEKLVLYYHVPFLIKHFSLNEDKIFFLERIAHLVNLSEDIYGCPASYESVNFEGNKCNADSYYQELMVRQAEFTVVNLDTELLSSFNGLVDYWKEYVSPSVQQLRDDFLVEQKLIDLSYHVE